MNSVKEMKPSFDQVTSVTDSKEFIESFCTKAIKLFEEFKINYSKAIDEQKISDLDSITHKITSTMKWLNLDDFVSLTRSYKDMDVSDQPSMKKLLQEVLHHSNSIESMIRDKLEAL